MEAEADKTESAFAVGKYVYGKGSKGMGTDLQIQNYEDIGKDSVRAQNYLYRTRRMYEISIIHCVTEGRAE